jgi:FkbM family methyltransferase
MLKSRSLLINLKHFIFRLYFRLDSHNYAFKQYATDLTESNLIKTYFDNLKNDGFFIHIGICHYEQDYFRPFFEKKNYKGLLIEANPTYIKNIKKNLNPNFRLENFLIDNNEISKYLYYVDNNSINKYPKYVKGICSTNKKNLILHHISERDIGQIKVESKKLSSLIKIKNINNIDFLIIDVEGMEFNILYDFLTNTNLRPNIIFEMKFMKKIEIIKVLDLLKKDNYDITLFKNDFICLNSPIKQ